MDFDDEACSSRETLSVSLASEYLLRWYLVIVLENLGHTTTVLISNISGG